MRPLELEDDDDDEPLVYEPISDAEFDALSLTSPPPAPGSGERAFGTIILVVVLAWVGIAVAWIAVDFPDRADHPQYWWWAIPVGLVSAVALGLAIQFRTKIDEPAPHLTVSALAEEASHPTRPHPLDAVVWFCLAWYFGGSAWFDHHLVLRVMGAVASAFCLGKAFLSVEELRERHTWAPLDKRRSAKDAALLILPILAHSRLLPARAFLSMAKVVVPATTIFGLWLHRTLTSGPPSQH